MNCGTPSPNGSARTFEIVTAIAYPGLAGVGTFMVVCRSQRVVGTIFLLSGLVLAAPAVASEYGSYGVLTRPGSLPAVRIVTWLGSWAWWAAAGLAMTFGLLLYPNGRLPSPRWLVLAAVATANLVMLVVLHAVTPGAALRRVQRREQPLRCGDGGPAPIARCRLGAPRRQLLLAIAALLAWATRASGEDRRQLRWLLVPATTAIAAPLWGLSSSGNRPSTASQWLVLAAVFGTPVVVATVTGRTARLARSLERLVLAREDERRRIRRDLHDGLGPTLAGVALQLDVDRNLVHEDPAAAERLIDSLLRQVKSGVADPRD